MISQDLFEKIKRKYGDVASWAVWAEAGDKPKSNVANMDVFDLEKNPSLLDILQNHAVMVGLNFSRSVAASEPFKNFHDSSPHANDFKIRYAFWDTPFYGAYMTDVIKNTPLKVAKDLSSYLNRHPDAVQENIALFRRELSDLETERPLLLAFGVDAYNLLRENLRRQEYHALIRLTHYSHQIGKENYRRTVTDEIRLAMRDVPALHPFE